jgi:hypothetical protein
MHLWQIYVASNNRMFDYYTNLLIKHTTAHLHLYNLQHVSAVTVWPPYARMFFLNKAVYGTLMLINTYI